MNRKLLSALIAGDVSLLRTLLQEDPSHLHSKTVKGNSVLHIAATHGNTWAVMQACNVLGTDLLLHQNARGDTALHCAARVGQAHIVELLIKRAEPTEKMLASILNTRGDAALHDAARAGLSHEVQQLVAADPEMAAVVNKDGESALYLAAERGSLAAVQELIGCPAVALGGPQGQHALHAAVCRSYDIANILLETKPALNLQTDASQSAPIHYAASLGDHSMVGLLLRYDASVAHLLDKDGLSAIHIAASKGNVNVINEILLHCPDATELTDKKGKNFLHVAAEKRRPAVVKHVLRKPMFRECINETDQEGNTPLHLATMNHSSEIVHLLLADSRVNTTVRNSRGLTPLDIASLCADSSIRLRMSNIMDALASAGSMFGPRRMDMIERVRRNQDEEISRYRALANNLAIVAVLIATVTFAAAFTLPGGYSNESSNQEQGMAILAKKLAFKLFLISDTIAMVSSIAVVCLLIYSGSLDHDIRLQSITTAIKFMWVALGGMVMAFSMGIYVVVVSKCRWLAVLVCAIACCVPLVAWMIIYWPPALRSLKLIKKVRNQRKNIRKTSIFKVVDLQKSHHMVDFDTPQVTDSALSLV